MASKSAVITAAIREEIVSGVYPPGARLPSQLDLVARFGVADLTVRAVLKQLQREGFVEARERSGTYVTANPPHLCQYGLVFWNDPSAPMGRETWSLYFQALTLAATRFEGATGRQILQFHGVDWHTDTPDRKRLIQYMETQRLAGVIFANIPLFLDGSPILELPGIPRVAFETRSQHPNVRTVVGYDYREWVDKALDWLQEQGRRKVAMIEYVKLDESFYRCFLEGLGSRGMMSQTYWRQFGSMRNPLAARHAVELLMHGRERPDALLIEDDNFVEQAVEGLLAAGVRVPEDVVVVGHANFPLPPQKRLPIRLLGQDVEAALCRAVAMIDQCRRGEVAPDTVSNPPLWEDEVGVGKKTEDGRRKAASTTERGFTTESTESTEASMMGVRLSQSARRSQRPA